MIHSHENVSFRHHVIFLFPFLDIFLLQDFHGIDLVAFIAFALDQHHLCIGSFADHRHHIELIQAQVLLIAYLHPNYNTKN